MQQPPQRLDILAAQSGDRKNGHARCNGSAELLLDSPVCILALRGLDQIDLARNDDDAPHVEKPQNREMLERLRHDSFAGIHDEQQELHTGRARQHVVQETLVPGHIDDAALGFVAETEVGEAQIERHASPSLLLPAIGIRSGQCLDECRFSVIDVSCRSNDVHSETRNQSGNVPGCGNPPEFRRPRENRTPRRPP